MIQIVADRGEADLGMVLQNADGREAEMSGNGMRCLAQAAVLSALVTPPAVHGRHGGRGEDGRVPRRAGGARRGGVRRPRQAVLGPDQPQKFPDRKVRTVDMGNPHLVMFGPDLDDVDVADIGARLQDVHEGGSTSSSSPRAPTRTPW